MTISNTISGSAMFLIGLSVGVWLVLILVIVFSGFRPNYSEVGYISRAFTLFDTSSLTSGATISAADIKMTSSGKQDSDNDAHFDNKCFWGERGDTKCPTHCYLLICGREQEIGCAPEEK